MDTSTWTVDDHIDWIRQYAEDARRMARMVIGWDLDALRVYTGLAEVVDWPETDSLWRRLRRGDSEPQPDPDTRVMHYGGYSYLVRDV
jgi:hypothetical protein